MSKVLCDSPVKELAPPPKSKFDMQKAPIKISDQAVSRIKELILQRERDTVGIRIGVKVGGCTGMAYTFEYADDSKTSDEIVNQDGINVLIDSKALLYILGTTLDYFEKDLESGFVFINPNEKGRCGCGESFYV
jgi:iron-sulfur cluster assembly protein